MCCIMIKPAGEKMPSKVILEMMASHNKDGFGFVTSSGKACKTMSYTIFMRELSKVKKSEECMVHMRWATHGSKSVHNCHPFYDKDTGIWFAHNGVLPIDSKNDMTDSEICFRESLIPAAKSFGYGSETFNSIVEKVRHGSRFAFMKNGKVETYGSWQEFEGCLYSNLNFLPYYVQEETKWLQRNFGW